MRIVFIYPLLFSAMWAQSTPPPPRPYKIAAMDNMYILGRSLNQRGEVFGRAYSNSPVRTAVIRWTPSSLNGGTGTQSELSGPFSDPGGIVPDAAGRIAYSNGASYVLSIWTPAAPGSSTGQSVDVTPPDSVGGWNTGINNFGQVLTSLLFGATGLWTPVTSNGTTGALTEFGFDVLSVMLNDHGQILLSSNHGFFHLFYLFQPVQPNTGNGSIVEVEMPTGSEYVIPGGLTARGDVAGEVCMTVPGAACQPRGFVWRPTVANGATGSYTIIGPPAGYKTLGFTGMNNKDEAVGIMMRDSGKIVPFVSTGGAIYELPMPGIIGTRPSILIINDAGQILVQPNYGSALLMTPYVAPTPDANAVSVTISTNSSTILPFTVTGSGCQAGSYPTPQVLLWTPGASCTVGWVTPQNLGLTRRRSFNGWADGAPGNPRTFTAPSTPTTLQALFREEITVGTYVDPPGTGTVTCPQWARLGEVVTCTATPNPGGRFLSWSPSGSTDPTITFAVKDPSEASSPAYARFIRTGPIPTGYGITTLSGVPGSDTALNNYGQVLHQDAYPVQLRVWTPSQPNGTSGAITVLSEMAVPGAFVGRSSMNDRGSVVADMIISSGPLRLWNPSTPNGATGTYYNIVSSGRLKGMNNYGQVAGSFNGVSGVWTPTAANGSTGRATTDARFGAINAFGPAGQTASASTTVFSMLDAFTPTSPNAMTGGFNSMELVYFTLSRLGRFGPRGELLFSNCVTGGPVESSCKWKPQVWRPVQADTMAGSMEDLPVLDGFWDFNPQFMNARGEVLGTMQTSNRIRPPFLISNGKMYDLGALPGLPDSVQIAGLNDAGQILLSLSTNIAQMFLLTPSQPAACMVNTVPYILSIGPSAGRTRAAVRADSSCVWAASSGSSWLSVVNTTGQGTGTLQLEVLRNDTGSQREAIVTINGFELHVKQATLPVVSFTPPILRFRGSGAAVSAPQEVQFLVNGTGTVNWICPTGYTPLTMSLGSGTFPGSVKFSLPPASSQLARTSGAINLNLYGGAQSAISIPYVIDQLPATNGVTPPFGAFETPADNANGVTGSISVTGWALDDFGVKSVTIWRDPVGPEAVQANGYVYIGDALFVRGARPDVRAQYPNSPDADRAGWGYMMLTYGLPGKGNGTYKLHAIATDEQGNQVKLGTKTITVDNAHATKPFGAIDSPAPGETISGTINNSGWALTPQPAFIATNGSTIWVNIDGVDVGHPLFGIGRGDISSIFPGYANSDTAGGQYSLDSTRFSDAMHAISWNLYDSQGHSDGVGSRYFYIQNDATAGSTDPEPRDPKAVEEERALQLRAARLRRPAAPGGGYPAFRRGYDRDAGLTPIRRAGDGLLEPIELKELDRLEIHLPAGIQEAGLRGGDGLGALPVGSTFDAEGEIFYWQLGPVFLGEYLLEFRAADGTGLIVPIRIGTFPGR